MFRRDRSLWLKYLLCLGVILVSPAAAAWGQQQISKHGVLELTFTASDPSSNPYTEKSMSATFTGTSGEANGRNLTVGGFWDGGDTWKVRFSPMYTGNYTYSTSSSDAGLSGHSGSFTCVNSSKRGRLKINPNHRLYFMWTNGDPYMMIGDTWWRCLHTAAPATAAGNCLPYDDATYINGIDTRISQKFNYIHEVVWYNYDDDLNGEPSFINNDENRLNPEFYQEMDLRIQYPAEREFIVGLLHGWADHNFWNKFSTTERNRFAQYLINRYAAYPVIWSCVGEYDEGGTSSDWHNFTDYCRSHDPYGNPVTMHPVGDGAMTEEGHLDFYEVQRFTNYFGHAVSSRSKGMPYINAEYGYEVEQYNATEILKYSWQLIMGGSAGLVYGNSDWYYINDCSTPSLYSQGTTYIQYLSEFWQENGIEYWTFSSFNDLGSGRYEAKVNGGQHVYWTESSASFNINLSDLSGTVPARWYNAKTGVWGSESSLSAGSSVQVTPPGQYYALLIGQGVVGNRGPTAIFVANPLSGVAPLMVDFDASGSSDPDGDNLDCDWTVKEGTSTIATGSGITWEFTFNTVGDYDVFLVVTDDGDPALSDTVSQAIEVMDQFPPTASFSADPMSGTFPFPLQVDFDASGSFDPDGVIVSYDWDFGDGSDTTLTGATVSHVYASPGSGAIHVVLTITDDDGATDSAEHNLDLYEEGAELIVSNINKSNYQTALLAEGDEYYVDRTYVINNIPGSYEGLLWIKTANDDKYNTSEEFLTFTVNQDVTAYVGYDHQISVPNWITGHYLNTGDFIEVGDLGSGTSMEVWSRDFSAGQVSMGGNMASGGSGAEMMYIVLLRGRGGAAVDTTAPLISQVTATNIIDTAVTIGWSTDESSDSQVEYGLTTAYGSTTPLNPALVTQHSLDLTGLSPQMLYHYRVRSADSSGNVAYSGDNTFETAQAPDVIPPQISSIEISSVSDTAATIGWSTDEPADSKVEYGLEAGSYSWSVEDTILTQSHLLNLMALTADTEYHFRVLSQDMWGNASTSADSAFSTTQEIPGAPGKPEHFDD